MDAQASTEAASEPIRDTPMVGWKFPTDSKMAFSETITDGALREVEAIKEQALSLGWTEAQLFQNQGRLKFPSGADYGLICFLKGGRRITRVTERSARIESPNGSTFTHFRNDGDQNPAVTLVKATKKRRSR